MSIRTRTAPVHAEASPCEAPSPPSDTGSTRLRHLRQQLQHVLGGVLGGVLNLSGSRHQCAVKPSCLGGKLLGAAVQHLQQDTQMERRTCLTIC